jgi:predicted RNase H-like HicB family nuclease
LRLSWYAARNKEEKDSAMRFLVHITQMSEELFQVSCPGLPGCITYGQSKEQAVQRMETAVRGYLASLDVPELTGSGKETLPVLVVSQRRTSPAMAS